MCVSSQRNKQDTREWLMERDAQFIIPAAARQVRLPMTPNYREHGSPSLSSAVVSLMRTPNFAMPKANNILYPWGVIVPAGYGNLFPRCTQARRALEGSHRRASSSLCVAQSPGSQLAITSDSMLGLSIEPVVCGIALFTRFWY